MMFTTVALETLHMLEAYEARLNARGRKLLTWLKARYPVRETVYADDEIMVTKLRLWPPVKNEPERKTACADH